MSLKDHLLDVNTRIDVAARRIGRKSEDITLLAVTKNVPALKVNEAISLGIKVIGENRVQEAENKFNQLKAGNYVRHFIGHLQSNKAKRALLLFDLIQSVDSNKLAQSINTESYRLDKKFPIFIQINAIGEKQKHGVRPESASETAIEISRLENIQLCGLMSMAPLTNDENIIRECFKISQKLFDEIKLNLGPNSKTFKNLSMGMSNDYEIAIEEGSTMVRIGHGLFG